MAPSTCQSVQEHLSAFLDGELGLPERAQIEHHLSRCDACRSQLAGFREVGRLFVRAGTDAAPDQWNVIESQLPTPHPVGWSWWQKPSVGVAVAIAASLLIAFGLWVSSPNDDVAKLASNDPAESSAVQHGSDPLMDEMGPNAMGMAEMAMDPEHMLKFQYVMDDYLAKLSVDPDQAEDFLLAKYDGQRVSPDQAESLVGYRPLISRGLPNGYELASSSVVKMPCCTCFKAVCRRADGSTLVLFEHDDEKAAWFGNRQSSMATCGDKDCCLVELNSNIAATWKEGSRSITAVGARDQDEVTTLVNALKQS
ncbi:anti-sigma factor family protein [Roseiconus lacunae]|uniref:Zf-HC2 domain-containing protein n=1 Tax=Roseiconus lacunae TaxID=2605694 RepID=A0ABT7PFD8_9BACT|nr:zf-HC2 domain-containing protein [Roseiconus lacunae]MDM4015083.1 zf-HC2 domain-containing protein [Roseiconus lacunae]